MHNVLNATNISNIVQQELNYYRMQVTIIMNAKFMEGTHHQEEPTEVVERNLTKE